MKKNLLIIIVVVAVIAVVLGTVPTSFEGMKDSIESIKASSYNLTADIATITLTYFAISDFAGHADGIEVEFYYRVDEAGYLTGESGWVYRSWRNDSPGGVWVEYIREEVVVVTPSGWRSGDPLGTGYEDMYFMCEKAVAPVADLIEFDRSEEAEWGFFERTFNAIRLGILTIQTVIMAFIVSIVDTVSLVWEFASASFKIIGITA